MHRDERLQIMTRAFAEYGQNDTVFVIFEEHDDRGGPLSYVQFAFTGDDQGILIEISSGFALTGGNTGILVRVAERQRRVIAQKQIDALVALGFSAERSPNYRGYFQRRSPEALADLCEQGFVIMGAPPSFDLVTKVGYWQPIQPPVIAASPWGQAPPRLAPEEKVERIRQRRERIASPASLAEGARKDLEDEPWWDDPYDAKGEFRMVELGAGEDLCPCAGTIAHEDSPPSPRTPCGRFWSSLERELGKRRLSLVYEWEGGSGWFAREDRKAQG